MGTTKLLYVKRSQYLPNFHTDIPVLPGESKMGCVMLKDASTGTGEKRRSCDTANVPWWICKSDISVVTSTTSLLLLCLRCSHVWVLIFVLAWFHCWVGIPHSPHVLSPDDIRHAGEAQAQPLGGKQKLDIKQILK